MLTYILLGIIAFFAVTRFIANRNSTVKRMTGKEALAAHAAGTATFIDVRTPAEMANGKLDGAKEANVTSASFRQAIANLDKSKPYIVYCRSGMRSARACKIMEKEGFTNLTNVAGGYMGMK